MSFWAASARCQLMSNFSSTCTLKCFPAGLRAFIPSICRTLLPKILYTERKDNFCHRICQIPLLKGKMVYRNNCSHYTLDIQWVMSAITESSNFSITAFEFYFCVLYSKNTARTYLSHAVNVILLSSSIAVQNLCVKRHLILNLI